MRVLAHDSARLRLSVRGPIGPLLQVATALDPIDMTARRADLDELFLTYYRTAGDGAATHGR